jgi:hypothetical protein
MAAPRQETLRHREAFDYYLALGPSRTLAAVQEKFGVSERAVLGWSKVFGWQDRIVEKERAIADKVSAKVENDIAEVKARQLKIARAVQGMFVRRVNDAVDPETGKFRARGWKPSAMDAARWADIERDIVNAGSGGGGSPGSIPEGLEGMEEEQIERFIVERITRLRRIRTSHDEGDGVPPRPGQP